MFTLFAELVAQHLDAHRRAVQAGRDEAELGERFIALLGHDLRSPLSAILAGVKLLEKAQTGERSRMLLHPMETSVQRMPSLIGDVLDVVRGRIGGGFPVTPVPDGDVKGLLDEIVREPAIAVPEGRIELHVDAAHPLTCDPARIGQLASNLIAEAPGGTPAAQSSPDRTQFVFRMPNLA